MRRDKKAQVSLTQLQTEMKGNEDITKYMMVGILYMGGGWCKKEKDWNAESGSTVHFENSKYLSVQILAWRGQKE